MHEITLYFGGSNNVCNKSELSGMLGIQKCTSINMLPPEMLLVSEASLFVTGHM
jgi:hypothetical protein